MYCSSTLSGVVGDGERKRGNVTVLGNPWQLN